MNGMADKDDDDTFFDDDFPDIPDDEFQRLEQDAITFTQQEQLKAGPRDDALSRKRTDTSYQPQRNDLSINGRPTVQNLQNPRPLPIQKHLIDQAQIAFDGISFDDNGLPIDVQEEPRTRPQKRVSDVAQREQFRVNRFAQPIHPFNHRASNPPPPARPLPSHFANSQTTNGRSGTLSLGQSHYSSNAGAERSDVGDNALRAQIAELLREREALTANLQEAKDEVSVRRGEIANVRAKLHEDEKAYQRQIQTLQKMKQSEAEKHANSMKEMIKEKEEVASEIQFLRQELKDEARRAQSIEQKLKERPLTDKPTAVNTTPKRNRSLRDGFDDDEIMVVSPMKSGRRSNKGTPTANRKRKQPTNANTNVQPLPLHLSGPAAHVEDKSVAPLGGLEHATTIVHKDHTAKRHLHLIQKVTNYRPSGGHETLLEHLFKHSFPSEVRKSFGTIVLDAISKLDGSRLPGDLAQIFIDLWARAMSEKAYLSISLLTEVISFILEQDPLIIDKSMLRGFLPILESTITINAAPRFRLMHMQREYLNNPEVQKPTIDTNINTTACLELLYTIACLCADDVQLIDCFWRTISTDFVLMLSSGFQTIPDITIMLRIVTTSILPETFGNICPPTEQTKYENYICDRACYLLIQSIKPDIDKPPYSQKQLCILRQESLDFLAQLSLGSSPNPFNPSIASNHGTSFLVNHPTAIARLVRCVYDELAMAYIRTPNQHLHVRLVNSAVRILHFVLFSPPGSQANWQTKFNAQNGGAHKFRVAMARLVFTEGTSPGIDAGISKGTTRMAREMLENSITPDEADELVQVFEGENHGASRRTSAIVSSQH